MTRIEGPGLPARGVYAITVDREQPLAALARDVAAALAAGVAMLQYRRKGAPHPVRIAEAQALRSLCSAHGARFIVNDDIALAREVGADGVHLGRDDADYRELLRVPARTLLVGVSCYASLARAEAAAAAGADYVAFGSFFPSVTKPEAAPAPLAILAEAKRTLSIPIVAIGGISPENGARLLRAGADFLAVITGIFDQDDIAAATARYRRLFETLG